MPAPARVAAPAAAGPVEVRVPDVGDFKDVAVIELLVKVGDTVQAEQSLMTVESDKAAMEIPSSATRMVREKPSPSRNASSPLAAKACACHSCPMTHAW